MMMKAFITSVETNVELVEGMVVKAAQVVKWQLNQGVIRMKIEATILNPTVPESRNLTMEHVWGKHEMESEHIPKIPIVWIHHGMIVATSHEDGLPKTCPVWGDLLKYKSVTVICRPCLEEEVKYWLEYVHGGGSVTRRKVISKNEIALRSDYQCW